VRKEVPKPSRAIIEALSDDLNTPAAITVLRENYKLARDGGDTEKNQFLMDCQFLGILRHDKLWVHMQGASGRNTRGLPIAYEEARKLRISVANSLPELQRETEKKLASMGLGAEVDSDGNVTLVPVSEATRAFETKIEALIADRTAARAAKNWKESDRIRDELAAMGVVLKDSKDGTTWEIAR
jgi:cysteinyl-tRNA synthetase